MAKQESKQGNSAGVVLGTKSKDITISEEEMTSLGEFLSTVQAYILNHEARLDALEEFVTEWLKAQGMNADAQATVAEDALESANDSPQG